MTDNNKSIRIAGVEIASPWILGPLAGITDASMRTLCEEQGASLTYTEMVSSKGLYYGDRKTPELTYIPENAGPTSIQIFGSEPDIMAAAAEKLNALRHSFLDINIGCPVPKVVRNGDGSALMQDPELVYRVVRATSSASDKPVTVKIRAGFTLETINAVEVAQAIESGGAAAVAVHGRTRSQYYSGNADWNVIREVKNAVSIPVIGNGDVFCAEDGMRMLGETGCDAVMIARGALGNPWIFRELDAAFKGETIPESADPAERIATMQRHLDMLLELKGERIAIPEFRKFVVWYSKGLRGAAQLRRDVNHIESAAEFKSALEKWVKEDLNL